MKSLSFFLLFWLLFTLDAKHHKNKHKKLDKNSKHDDNVNNVPATTSWWYWIEYAKSQSSYTNNVDWSQNIPSNVNSEENAKNNVVNSGAYYDGNSYQPPMDSYPEGQQYQNHGHTKNQQSPSGLYDLMCNQNEPLKDKDDGKNKNHGKNKDDNPLSADHKWTASDNGFDNNINNGKNKEDSVICHCRSKNLLKNGTLDNTGFNQCMNDKNGNSAEDWRRSAKRIQHWSDIYQSQYQGKGYDATYNGDAKEGKKANKHHKKKSKSGIDFTMVAITCAIFGVMFLVLFGYQCVQFSWKSWKMKGYESVESNKKTNVVYMGDIENIPL